MWNRLSVSRLPILITAARGIVGESSDGSTDQWILGRPVFVGDIRALDRWNAVSIPPRCRMFDRSADTVAG